MEEFLSLSVAPLTLSALPAPDHCSHLKEEVEKEVEKEEEVERMERQVK